MSRTLKRKAHLIWIFLLLLSCIVLIDLPESDRVTRPRGLLTMGGSGGSIPYLAEYNTTDANSPVLGANETLMICLCLSCAFAGAAVPYVEEERTDSPNPKPARTSIDCSWKVGGS